MCRCAEGGSRDHPSFPLSPAILRKGLTAVKPECGAPRPGYRHRLEQGAHLVWRRQTVHGALNVRLNRRRFSVAQLPGTFQEPERKQKISLINWSMNYGARRPGGLRQSLEVDMGGQIGFARLIQRVDRFVVFHGLQSNRRRPARNSRSQ